ncbi:MULTISPECIES: hypothetical protein [Metallosphaera]|uniref:Uncharacterized protein n=3 Tax=Metallosphaera TaxID=41980 RepID=A4YF71_METS5|nr:MULTISPECIES: hypothetical protein [Metallosphaera]ABP95073.1 hypothetical protein Msed_0901 [Metallosphaera sedula DSM 5348]AIM27059.1 hypothetical protein HA72_0901 [Metallosphaera sedula]AKV73975.1 hypothetical protein MsedA_0917 [Metallosphaera sedula]AKV76214.1 hypothetical protein MsedB_0918 [Metallosphaera sedula]AKV78467.1 hypothetical protein MsedC_0917 [Metallosphaera sedula]
MDPKIIIRLLEERPRYRGNKVSEAGLKRLAKLAEENVELMKELGCFRVGGEVYWRTNCIGGYY